jgi:Icc-related predicted phosphoesterase
MKILCVADEIDPLVHSIRIRERFGDVDLVLSAGDLPMDYLSYIVSALNKPLLFVFGNHNLKELPYLRPTAGSKPVAVHDYGHDSGATYIGFKSRREAGLIVFGFGGSMRYNNGPNQFTQAQMWARVLLKVPALLLNRLLFGRAVDIVLTHSPPKGVHDRPDVCHRGFAAFLWLMRVWKPRYLVHGHIHIYDAREERIARYAETTIINTYGYHVLDTEADHA